MTQRQGSVKDAAKTKQAPYARIRRFLSGTLRFPVTAFAYLFRPAPTSSSRRALLQGQVWKLIPRQRFAPLVTRLPHPNKQEPSRSERRTIRGINIEPVPPTNLGSKPLAGTLPVHKPLAGTLPVHKPLAGTLPVHRPPGAVDEFQFLAGCTRCGDCMGACPYNAIVKAPHRLGSVAGTPIIEADTAACMMCEDYPCIAACVPGVLTDSVAPIMGTARVTEHLCLAHHHTTCTVCTERCPVEGAITVEDGKPTVEEDHCTGCGVCRYVCPAPENAILLMPAFSRPGLPQA